MYFSTYKTLNFFSNIMGERQEVYIRIPRSLKHAIMQFKAFHSSNHFL